MSSPTNGPTSSSSSSSSHSNLIARPLDQLRKAFYKRTTNISNGSLRSVNIPPLQTERPSVNPSIKIESKPSTSMELQDESKSKTTITPTSPSGTPSTTFRVFASNIPPPTGTYRPLPLLNDTFYIVIPLRKDLLGLYTPCYNCGDQIRDFIFSHHDNNDDPHNVCLLCLHKWWDEKQEFFRSIGEPIYKEIDYVECHLCDYRIPVDEIVQLSNNRMTILQAQTKSIHPRHKH